MAVQSETDSISYEGNNSDVTAYVVPFLFYKDSHLSVVVTDFGGNETTLDPSEYTVTGEAEEEGGEVVTHDPYDSSHTITINRDIPITQLFVFEEGARIPMKTIEKAFDYQVMMMQRIKRIAETAARSPRVFGYTGDLNDATPDFIGQLALVIDDHTLYHASSTTQGDWVVLVSGV